jgi:copper resistance protein D
MVFLSVVLAPLVRQRKAVPEFMALFRTAALRFRIVVYGAIALLLGTGPLLLHERGIAFLDPGQWPTVLRVKLGMVVLLLLLTAAHDLILGPRIRTIGAGPVSARSSWDRALMRSAGWLPRISLLLALAVVWVAAILARS